MANRIRWPDMAFPPINLYSAPHRDEAIASPCVRQCLLKDDTCTGCGRTLDEIREWRHMTNKQRRAVMDRLIKELND